MRSDESRDTRGVRPFTSRQRLDIRRCATEWFVARGRRSGCWLLAETTVSGYRICIQRVGGGRGVVVWGVVVWGGGDWIGRFRTPRLPARFRGGRERGYSPPADADRGRLAVGQDTPECPQVSAAGSLGGRDRGPYTCPPTESNLRRFWPRNSGRTGGRWISHVDATRFSALVGSAWTPSAADSIVHAHDGNVGRGGLSAAGLARQRRGSTGRRLRRIVAAADGEGSRSDRRPK